MTFSQNSVTNLLFNLLLLICCFRNIRCKFSHFPIIKALFCDLDLRQGHSGT